MLLPLGAVELRLSVLQTVNTPGTRVPGYRFCKRRKNADLNPSPKKNLVTLGQQNLRPKRLKREFPGVTPPGRAGYLGTGYPGTR
eukprot:3810433-Rhodomonas_salina.1